MSLELLQSIGWLAVSIVIALGGPLLLIFIKGWIKKHCDQLDSQKQLIIQTMTTDLVTQSITYAEQIAAKKKKENENIHGKEKLYVATKFLFDHIRESGLPEITEEIAEQKIESFLGLQAI